MKYKPYSLHNFRQIPQMEFLTEQQKFEVEVVGTVLPFKTDNYVVDELIDWKNLHNLPQANAIFNNKKLTCAIKYTIFDSGSTGHVIVKGAPIFNKKVNKNPI